MTLAFTNLGASAAPDINDNADATSYASASWAPPVLGLIYVFVSNRVTAGVPTIPTISGNSLTWVQIGTNVPTATQRRITLFAALAAGATTGVTTVDFGGVTQLCCEASFAQVTGADVSGGVLAAFVQVVGPSSGAAATGGSITLSAAGASRNRPISAFQHNQNELATPRTNWTEVDDFLHTLPINGFETQWRSDAFETTASATWTTSVAWNGLAAEIKAAADAGPIAAPTATATADGLVPTPKVTVAATLATSTADGLAPTTKITSLPGVADATGAALVPTLGVGLAAPVAIATADALVPTPKVIVVPGVAAALAAALAPSLAIGMAAPAAAAQADALVPGLALLISAAIAEAAAVAVAPTLSIGMSAPSATAIADALAPSTGIQIDVPSAQAQAAALEPTPGIAVASPTGIASASAFAPVAIVKLQALVAEALAEALRPRVVAGDPGTGEFAGPSGALVGGSPYESTIGNSGYATETGEEW